MQGSGGAFWPKSGQAYAEPEQVHSVSCIHAIDAPSAPCLT